MKPGTPSQTVGPFFHPSMRWAVRGATEPIGDDEALVEGRVTDARCEIVSNAVIEIWQPHAVDPRAASRLPGFQRVFTAPAGDFAFTVKAHPHGLMCAHVTIFSLGLMGALRTRVYLGVSPEDLERVDDLRYVPRDRLSTLIAAPGDAARRYRWPIRLQGEGETVFFAIE